MENKKLIIIELTEEEREIILRASKIASMGHSTFCRVISLEKARAIINQQKEVSA